MPYVFVKGKKKTPKFKPVHLEKSPRALGQLKYNLQRTHKKKRGKSLARSFIGY